MKCDKMFIARYANELKGIPTTAMVCMIASLMWIIPITCIFRCDQCNRLLRRSIPLHVVEPIVEVALSAQELTDCVGKEYGVTGKVCDGLPLVWAPNPSTRTVSPTASSTTTPTRRRSVGSTSTTLLDTRSLLLTTSWVCSIWWWEDRDD